MLKIVRPALAALAAGAVLMSLATTADADANKKVKIINETRHAMVQFHASRVGTKSWEEDILGQDTLANGESLKISFDDRDKRVHWDLKVTDKEGNSLEWEDLNLVEISEVTLHWDAKKGKGWADLK